MNCETRARRRLRAFLEPLWAHWLPRHGPPRAGGDVMSWRLGDYTLGAPGTDSAALCSRAMHRRHAPAHVVQECSYDRSRRIDCPKRNEADGTWRDVGPGLKRAKGCAVTAPLVRIARSDLACPEPRLDLPPRGAPGRRDSLSGNRRGRQPRQTLQSSSGSAALRESVRRMDSHLAGEAT